MRMWSRGKNTKIYLNKIYYDFIFTYFNMQNKMNMDLPIFSHGAGSDSVFIFERPSSVRFELGSNPAGVYKPYFDQFSKSVEEGKSTVWVFQKSESQAIALISRVIGKDLTTLYRQQIPNFASNGNLSMSMDLLSGAQKVVKVEEKVGVYPRMVWEKETVHGFLFLGDYTEKSVALYTPLEWGRENGATVRSSGGKFIKNLKVNSQGKKGGKGWIFAKSNEKAISYLENLTGINVLEKAPRIGKPFQKKQRGRGDFVPKIEGSVTIVPQNNEKFDEVKVEETNPLAVLNKLIGLMEHSSTGFTKENLQTPDNTSSRVGFFGENEAVESNLTSYQKRYGNSKVLIDIAFGEKRALVVERKL